MKISGLEELNSPTFSRSRKAQSRQPMWAIPIFPPLAKQIAAQSAVLYQLKTFVFSNQPSQPSRFSLPSTTSIILSPWICLGKIIVSGALFESEYIVIKNYFVPYFSPDF